MKPSREVLIARYEQHVNDGALDEWLFYHWCRHIVGMPDPLTPDNREALYGFFADSQLEEARTNWGCDAWVDMKLDTWGEP